MSRSDPPQPEALTPEGERELFETYRSDPTERNLNRILRQYERLVYKIAQKYHQPGVEMDDLIQVGMMGLWLAIQRFDLDKGVRFTTYAYQTIQGEILRYFRDCEWAMRVPRSLKNRCLKVLKERERLGQELGRDPTLKELAEAVELTLEETAEALELGSAYHPASIVEELEARPVGPAGGVLGGTPSPPEEGVLFNQLMKQLSPMEEQVMRMRIEEGLTQQEIADILGVSQMYISRLQRRVLEKLRTWLDPEILEEQGLL